jgi:small nuclear ribonucleoprotein (snRNP)-like protein
MQRQQQQQQQRRSRSRSSTSLVALLLALQGRKLTVELRSDVMVTGTLAEVDDHMNMFIDSAVWTPVEGAPQVRRRVVFVSTHAAAAAAATAWPRNTSAPASVLCLIMPCKDAGPTTAPAHSQEC